MAKLLGTCNATLDIIHLVDSYPKENDEVRCSERCVRRGGNLANTLVVLSQPGVVALDRQGRASQHDAVVPEGTR